MVFDPETHKKNRMKFLGALRELVADQMKESGRGDPQLICVAQFDIAEKAGLTRNDADRIMAELLHEDLINAMSGDERGPLISLTLEGCRIAEEHLFEKSAAGKRRKVSKFLKEKGLKAAEAGVGKSAAWIGVYLAGVFSGVSGKEILRLIRRAFGGD